MKGFIPSGFVVVAFGAAASLAQDFCAAVTEYVTITAFEAIASEPPTSETPSNSLLPVTDIAAIATSESFCGLSPVTLTTTLEPTTITIYTSPTSTSDIATDCSLFTVWVTEDLEPTTVTVYPSSEVSSIVETHQNAPLSPPKSYLPPSVDVSQVISFAPLTSDVQTPTPAPTPSAVAEVPSFVLVSQVEEAVKTSAAPAATTSSTEAQENTNSPSLSGEATFYGGNVDGGMCSFTGYHLPSGIFGTALSDSNWDDSGACGTCIEVTGPSGNKITAMVVDQCPGCGTNHVDLFSDAFAALADPSKGVIDVSWSIVPCGITTPITLKNKSGTSKYYFNIQIENANVQVKKVDVSTDEGKTWVATTRKEYNFFEISGGTGTESVSVKITSTGGEEIVVDDVSCADSATMSAGSNF